MLPDLALCKYNMQEYLCIYIYKWNNYLYIYILLFNFIMLSYHIIFYHGIFYVHYYLIIPETTGMHWDIQQLLTLLTTHGRCPRSTPETVRRRRNSPCQVRLATAWNALTALGNV